MHEGECNNLGNMCENCSDVLMPVCATNGTTYKNLCELRCE